MLVIQLSGWAFDERELRSGKGLVSPCAAYVQEEKREGAKDRRRGQQYVVA